MDISRYETPKGEFSIGKTVLATLAVFILVGGGVVWLSSCEASKKARVIDQIIDDILGMDVSQNFNVNMDNLHGKLIMSRK